MNGRTYIEELPSMEDILPPGQAGNVQRAIRSGSMKDNMRGAQPQGPPMPQQMNGPPFGPSGGEMMMEQPQLYPTMSCMDILRHMEGCPICQKIYHCDKTLYLIIIVVLAILSILLLKRILEI